MSDKSSYAYNFAPLFFEKVALVAFGLDQKESHGPWREKSRAGRSITISGSSAAEYAGEKSHSEYVQSMRVYAASK